VGLARLVAFLHMREHVEVGLGVVVKDAPAGRHVVIECLRYKLRIGQKVAQAARNCLQGARQRFALEQAARFGAEFIESASHGSSLRHGISHAL
jgi:hypothetical protein